MILHSARLLPLRLPQRYLWLSAAVLLASMGVPGSLCGQNPNEGTGQNPPVATMPAPLSPDEEVPAQANQVPSTSETPAARTARLQRELSQAQEAEEQQSLNRTRRTPLTPEPPSPFQKMVWATTGQHLEVYGSALFRGVPSTFAPVEDVPVGPDYILGPGDELQVQISGQVNRQLALTIDRTGSVSIPEVGTVHVAGMPYGQLTSYLNQQLGRIYRNFTVNATLGALRTIQVFVVGQARRPGSFSVSSLSTLLNALFASGGPLPTGSVRDIQVRRGGKTIDHFDLYELLLHGDKSRDIPLATGDVIFIPFAGPQVAVLGSVNHPAIYELKNETTVAQALAFAGGESSVASNGNVLLERVYEHSERSAESVSLDSVGTTQVQNGDILSVRSVVDRFRNAVTLRGNVANPGRYAWHPGMRVSDLIPNRESLVTRDYWRRRNQLGQFLLEENPGPLMRTGRPSNRTQTQSTPQQNTPVPVTGTEQQMQEPQPSQPTGTQPYSTEDGGELQMDGNMQAQPTEPGQQNNSNSSQGGGGSVGAALTNGSRLFKPKNDVVLSAPDIDWSYAVIERQDAKTLTTSLIPFNLGKIVIEGDASQDIELLPGDVVTIFSKADIRVPTVQQTRYVRLEGEIIAAGVYSVQPGETLRGLLRRAGGFTPDAYLYASEFTRESTRRVEQQRLNEYADQLEAQLVASNAANQTKIGADQAAAMASEARARATVERLRRVQPTGRLVLDLKPDSSGIDSVPDISLEDGDRFVVPRVPSNVTVEGQVYSASAFIYRPGEHARTYLRQAGGPDRQADRKRMFILRADGSVVSEQYANVGKAMIYPGDTIVVPPNLQPHSVLQRTLDIAQIAGNLALSAAAIAVLARQ